MNYQAPQIEWQEPKNNEVIYGSNYYNDVICFWHSLINSYFIRKNPDEKSPKSFVVDCGGMELKEMASIADTKEWVEKVHYPSALIREGFKPVDDLLSNVLPELDTISAELKFILSQCEIMRQLGEDEEKFMYHYTINRFSNRIDGAVYLIQSLLGVQSESD